jgi:hypothetical protein
MAQRGHGRIAQAIDLILIGDIADMRRGANPVSAAIRSAASPRRRSWKSLMRTRAPSSAARLATAKPIPVPAAAVTTTVLPFSRPRGAG